jgi:hypothetical protein
VWTQHVEIPLAPLVKEEERPTGQAQIPPPAVSLTHERHLRLLRNTYSIGLSRALFVGDRHLASSAWLDRLV